MENNLNKNSVCWFEIYVNDMEKMQKFYETVFSTKLEKLNNPEVEIKAFPKGNQNQYGICGALVHIPGCAQPGGNNTIVYFACEDCSVELLRFNENGGSIHKNKFSIGEYGFIALGLDPEGNMIGLHSLR